MPPSYFHGGVPGKYPRDLLLPPTRTRSRSMAEVASDGVCRTDRVYLTSELEVARLFACIYPPRGRGWVYEVEPLGIVEPDPWLRLVLMDPAPESSFAVAEARVVRVVERGVRRWRGMDVTTMLREIGRRCRERQSQVAG